MAAQTKTVHEANCTVLYNNILQSTCRFIFVNLFPPGRKPPLKHTVNAILCLYKRRRCLFSVTNFHSSSSSKVRFGYPGSHGMLVEKSRKQSRGAMITMKVSLLDPEMWWTTSLIRLNLHSRIGDKSVERGKSYDWISRTPEFQTGDLLWTVTSIWSSMACLAYYLQCPPPHLWSAA